MNSLLGLELPTPVNFIIAFLVVLGLIGAATWAVRRFGGTRLENAGRGRQPRLAVIDSAAVDSRRKLMIVRRDNVEHLLMIGGPTDVVIESNIVRGNAVAPRDASVRGGADTLPRAIPLPDPAPWPMTEEPVSANDLRAQRFDEVDERPGAPPPLQAPQPQVRPSPMMAPPAVRPPQPRADDYDSKHSAPEPQPVLRPPVATHAAEEPADETNLTEMAQRLEAALRRPMASPPTPPVQVQRPVQPAPRPLTASRPAPPAQPPRAEPQRPGPSMTAPQPATPAPQAATPQVIAPPPSGPPLTEAARKAAAVKKYESLEQEMASLLGRPSSGKT